MPALPYTYRVSLRDDQFAHSSHAPSTLYPHSASTSQPQTQTINASGTPIPPPKPTLARKSSPPDTSLSSFPSSSHVTGGGAGIPVLVGGAGQSTATVPKVASPLSGRSASPFSSGVSTASSSGSSSSAYVSRPVMTAGVGQAGPVASSSSTPSPRAQNPISLYSTARIPSSQNASSSRFITQSPVTTPSLSASGSGPGSGSGAPPIATPTSPVSPRRHPERRSSSFGTYVFQRRPDSESRAFSLPRSSPSPSRGRPDTVHGCPGIGTMVLYRLEGPALTGASSPMPLSMGSDLDTIPPRLPFAERASGKRDSVPSTHSASGESILSMSLDSKYPSILGIGGLEDLERGGGGGGGIVAYAYDPDEDDDDDDDDTSDEGKGKQKQIHGKPHFVDLLHDSAFNPDATQSWRGYLNVFTLLVILAGLLALFVGYPIIDSMR